MRSKIIHCSGVFKTKSGMNKINEIQNSNNKIKVNMHSLEEEEFHNTARCDSDDGISVDVADAMVVDWVGLCDAAVSSECIIFGAPVASE